MGSLIYFRDLTRFSTTLLESSLGHDARNEAFLEKVGVMESFFQKFGKGLMISAAVWATACSEVKFTPGEVNSSLSVPDGSQKESFAFNDDGSGAKVDILFVVDNSGSMYEEQGRLGTALSSFINSIGNIDWQIGITTTDISDGPYGLKGSLLPFAGIGSKVLNKNTPNYATAFANTVVRSETLNCNGTTIVCPSSDERPLQAAVLAMQKSGGENSALFRQGADLAVVILSDEDEGSDGTNAIAATAVRAAFAAVFGGAKSFSAYGLIIQPGNTACFNQNSAGGGQYGTFVTGLAALTGGVTGSICDADYGPALTNIGNRVRQIVRSVTLKYIPNPDTVQIVIRPFDSSLTWQITGSTIMFNKPPKKGTMVDVVYLPKK